MPKTKKATQAFRDAHVELRRMLEAQTAALGDLTRASPEVARAIMARAIVFLDEEVRPHANAEEVKLYPALDGAVGGREPFTATMRHEHAIIDRWIEELAVHAGSTTPDAAWFTRRADRLFGLIEAHFEEEEVLLLPVLDRVFETEDQLERAVGGEIHAHSTSTH